MNIGYYGSNIEKIKIGHKIKCLRTERGYTLKRLVSELIEKGIFDYTAQTLQRRITNLENGNLYFGATTTIAIERRGRENLALLSQYLAFFEVSGEDRIINDLKRFDRRFIYSQYE